LWISSRNQKLLCLSVRWSFLAERQFALPWLLAGASTLLKQRQRYANDGEEHA